MKALVKKYLIPHKANDHKPHLLRGRGVTVLAAVVLVLFFGTLFLQQTLATKLDGLLAAIVSSVLVDLTNADRVANDLPQLSINPLLVEAAEQKANDMAQKEYFAHTSPEGLSPWYFISGSGYQFTHAGENLAVNFSDSMEVEEAWMNSPKHQANILSYNFTEIGIATARGTYKGRPTIFVVQMFGRPAYAGPVEQAPQSPEPAAQEIVETPETAMLGEEALVVAGERTASVEIVYEDEMLLVVENARPVEAAPAVAVVSQASFLERLLSSPRLILNLSYGVLGALVALVLALMVAVEIRKQYPLEASYALALLVLMTALLYANFVLFGNVLIV